MDKYLKTADSDWYKQRLISLMICVLAAFVILFVRLIYLQVITGEELRRLSLNNSIRLQSIEPLRGVLFDKNGKVLVDNRPSFDLSIILKDAEPLELTVGQIASSNTAVMPIGASTCGSVGSMGSHPITWCQNFMNLLPWSGLVKKRLPFHWWDSRRSRRCPSSHSR